MEQPAYSYTLYPKHACTSSPLYLLVQMCSTIIHGGSILSTVCAGYGDFWLLLMCVDINECLFNMDNCSQVCTNTEGGFACSCGDGYTLGEDGTSCEGVVSN